MDEPAGCIRNLLCKRIWILELVWEKLIRKAVHAHVRIWVHGKAPREAVWNGEWSDKIRSQGGCAKIPSLVLVNSSHVSGSGRIIAWRLIIQRHERERVGIHRGRRESEILNRLRSRIVDLDAVGARPGLQKRL